MRPRGATRLALGQAIDMAGQPLTWRAMATFARVGFEAAKRTAKNMAQAGELQVVGLVRDPGANRPMRLYARPQAAPGDALARAWMQRG